MVPLLAFSERLTVTRFQTSPFGSIHLSFHHHYFQVKYTYIKLHLATFLAIGLGWRHSTHFVVNILKIQFYSAFAGSVLQYKLEQYKREQTAANELSSVARHRRQPDLVRHGLLPMVRSNHYSDYK